MYIVSLLKEPNTDVAFIDVELMDTELYRVSKQRLIQLISQGIEDPRELLLRYEEEFKENFVCPFGRKHGLRTCLKHHFSEDISVRGKGLKSRVYVTHGATVQQAEDTQDLVNKQVRCLYLNPIEISLVYYTKLSPPKLVCWEMRHSGRFFV